jgi:phospholipase C
MSDVTGELTRRELLAAGAAGGAVAALSGLAPGSLVRDALAVPPRCGRLSDIEHVVILMQENRSFDHYFGSYRGVRGFGDHRGRDVFAQDGYDAPGFGGKLLPFHFDPANGLGECTNDVSHEWVTQHASWNNGGMDAFYRSHKLANGPAAGASTMGYYRRADLALYYALADAFTICDRFHCSVIGPTDPNRLYAMSGTVDPAGLRGGPLLQTLVGTRGQKAGAFSWTTMPEQLLARGISCKVYTDPRAGIFQNVLPYFHNFQADPQLKALGITPNYPDDFEADVAAGRLPQVTWVLPQFTHTEHPPAAPIAGEFEAARVLAALTADRERWAKTALILTYDEDGGFFDHVRPPTAPPGTPDEYITVSSLPPEAQGIRGPIGLGFRVPTLVISPFSRGGLVSSEVFDHTSVLQFLEARFGAEVPNLSAWRRSVTGDLTTAFNFAGPDATVPDLPQPSLSDPALTNGSCVTLDERSYPVPPNQRPTQERGHARRPSGLCRRDRDQRGDHQERD